MGTNIVNFDSEDDLNEVVSGFSWGDDHILSFISGTSDTKVYSDGSLLDTIDDGASSFDYSSLGIGGWRSEEHTSELQSRTNLVCRLLLEKKKKITNRILKRQLSITKHSRYTNNNPSKLTLFEQLNSTLMMKFESMKLG